MKVGIEGVVPHPKRLHNRQKIELKTLLLKSIINRIQNDSRIS